RRLPQERIAVRLLVVLAPRPVHADVGVILRLPGDRVSVAEEELLVRIVLEMVDAAEIDQRGGLCLRRGQAFFSVGKQLAPNLQALAERVLQQKSAVGEIAI